VPADELSYSLAAPAGFVAPAGSFTANAGASGNGHTISMSTASSGVKAGTLTVSCDDPDSTAKQVQLSGKVLDHAAASLDSMVVAHSDTLDFGTHSAGGFSNQDACIYNVGWDALQAKLEVTGGVISGGAGRFSIVGGFQGAEVADIGHCYAVHFDATGATLDSTYEATLTLSSSDEALPGAQPQADLVTTLRARPTSGPVGVEPGVPDLLAFHPPRPNPFRGETMLGFDLPLETNVSLDVFDLTGRRVAGILEGHEPAGRHLLRWRPGDQGGALRAGLYFIRFRVPGFSQTRRLVVVQ
jgi:hypothetical protein